MKLTAEAQTSEMICPSPISATGGGFDLRQRISYYCSTVITTDRQQTF